MNDAIRGKDCEMKHPTRQSLSAFTLVELLVSISIIALLIAILLPVLAQARTQVLRLKGANNMRQMELGFLTYAVDSRDTLPRSNNHPWGFGPWYFQVNHGGDKVNLLDIAKSYGFDSATAHPVVGTPALSDAANIQTSQFLGASWEYLPGYLVPSMAATTKVAQGPLRASSNSRYQMMQDFLVHARGHPAPLRWQAVQVSNVAVRRIEGGAGNPSFAFFGTNDNNLYPGTPAENARNVIGAYCGYYDGSVSFSQTKDFKWALWNTWGSGLYFAHRQYEP